MSTKTIERAVVTHEPVVERHAGRWVAALVALVVLAGGRVWAIVQAPTGEIEVAEQTLTQTQRAEADRWIARAGRPVRFAGANVIRRPGRVLAGPDRYAALCMPEEDVGLVAEVIEVGPGS